MTSYLPHRRGRYARAYQWVDGTLVVMTPPEIIPAAFTHLYSVEIVGSYDRLGAISRWSSSKDWFAQIAPGWEERPFRTRKEAVAWLFECAQAMVTP